MGELLRVVPSTNVPFAPRMCNRPYDVIQMARHSAPRWSHVTLSCTPNIAPKMHKRLFFAFSLFSLFALAQCRFVVAVAAVDLILYSTKKMKLSVIAILATTVTTPVRAFLAPSGVVVKKKHLQQLRDVSFDRNSEASETTTTTTTTFTDSFPFFKASAVIRNSDLAGNAGFDPLRLAKSREQLWHYREAEIKHARLAMLVRTLRSFVFLCGL